MVTQLDVQHLGSWGLCKPRVYLWGILVSKHGGEVSSLLLNVLFVKLSVGQVLSPLLQSRWERKKKRDSDRAPEGGLLGRHEEALHT